MLSRVWLFILITLFKKYKYMYWKHIPLHVCLCLMDWHEWNYLWHMNNVCLGRGYLTVEKWEVGDLEVLISLFDKDSDSMLDIYVNIY